MGQELETLRISSVMQKFGLTARALRFYEEKGLLSARRGHHNARHYDSAALEQLQWIAPLRKADVPVQEIRKVLEIKDERQRKLRAIEALQRRRSMTLPLLDAIDGALAELKAKDAL